jgi:myo-inositol-1(or 4)-monophosphatase
VSTEDAAFSAQIAHDLLVAGVEQVSQGYASLVVSFASDPHLRALVEVAGPDAVLLGDNNIVVRARRRYHSIAAGAEGRAEGVMRALLRETLPSHAVAPADGNSRWLWVFDGVDGTGAMVRTALAEALGIGLPEPLPAFGLTIAVLHEDEPVVGVIGQLRPHFGGLGLARLWVGVSGRQTTCDGAPVFPGSAARLCEATLASTVPEVVFADSQSWSAFQALRERCAAFVPDQNCVGFAHLLGGGVEVVAERDLALTDVAALVPVLHGAGVVVSDHVGRRVRFDGAARAGEYSLLAAAPALHAEALAVMREAAPGDDPGPRAVSHAGYERKFVA